MSESGPVAMLRLLAAIEADPLCCTVVGPDGLPWDEATQWLALAVAREAGLVARDALALTPRGREWAAAQLRPFAALLSEPVAEPA